LLTRRNTGTQKTTSMGTASFWEAIWPQCDSVESDIDDTVSEVDSAQHSCLLHETSWMKACLYSSEWRDVRRKFFFHSTRCTLLLSIVWHEFHYRVRRKFVSKLKGHVFCVRFLGHFKKVRQWLLHRLIRNPRLKRCLHYHTCTAYMHAVQLYGVHVW